MNTPGTFVTAINCMDGRTQLPVIDYMLRTYSADFVDSITEPGPCGILAEQNDTATIESILHRVRISTDNHGSGVVAVVGHGDCAGNPLPDDTQRDQLAKAKRFLQERLGNTDVVALWVNERWDVSAI